MIMKHIDGNDSVKLSLYTLSTCIWCKMTKKLLNDLGVGYDYVDMDSLEGEEKEEALENLKRWNPKCSFPSLVINDEICIVGYDDKKIREAIGR
jgi:glutaredoxin-like protein NrdH